MVRAVESWIRKPWVQILGRFVHFTLLQFIQLYARIPGYIDSGGYLHTNVLCASLSAWLNTCHRSWDCVRLNESAREYSVKHFGPVTQTGQCYIITDLYDSLYDTKTLCVGPTSWRQIVLLSQSPDGLCQGGFPHFYYTHMDELRICDKDLKWETYLAIADGAISSRFSMLHSSRNSRMGEGWEPTEIYAISARFFTRPTAPPCGWRRNKNTVKNTYSRSHMVNKECILQL